MRSKSKARKLLQENAEEDIDHYDDVIDEVEDDSPEIVNNTLQSSIPEEFELKASEVLSGEGLYTKYDIRKGQVLGNLPNGLDSVAYPEQLQTEITEEERQNWLKSAGQDSGHWMKFVRSSGGPGGHNLMAVTVHGQVFYKTIRDICAGEEMLLLNSEAVYQEREKAGTKLKDDIDNKRYSSECGEEFESRSNLQEHQTYDSFHSNRYNVMPPRVNDDVTNDEHAETKSIADSEQSIEEPPVGGDNGEYKCDECPRSFQWKSNLIRHQISHDSGKKFSCENCDKVFTDPSNLQRHIRSQHVGARSHACPECGKTFATSSGLKQHQHIHSSVKPFQCEVCLKAYTQFSNLCRHKRMHADCRQQIKCKDCGQAFSTVTSLSKHKRFCEGALRNGIHLGFPPAEKLSPLGLNSVSGGVHAPSPINPALYMGMYRPPYPFYPPVGATFPVFPGSHAFPSLGSPLLPSKVPEATSPQIKGIVSPSSSPKPAEGDKSENNLKRRNSVGSESNDSPISSGSDVDMNSSGSDAESESSISKRPRKSNSLDSSKEGSESLFSSRSSMIPFVPTRPSLKPLSLPSPQLSPIVPKVESDLPFDLSKSQKSQTPSPAHVSPAKPTGSGSGEQPLDLTSKAPKEEKPLENPRRTHIFGINGTSVDSRLHYAYPQFSNALIMEQMKMEREKLQQSFQEAVKFLPLPRFPLGSSSYASAALGMIKQEEKNVSPMLKMNKMPDHFPYGGHHKLKERYSCKYCGKVFPRSANLTRHLRTHTGEQPYKCKYCERSFSISSNLQRHVRNIHNKEKPFRCTLCDRCFGQQTNLDRHLKKHETEGLDVQDSPSNDHDLDSKDESYFSEIRNFIGKATSSGLPVIPMARNLATGLHPLIDHRVDRDDTFDAADDDIDEEDDFDDELDDDVSSREHTPTGSLENVDDSHKIKTSTPDNQGKPEVSVLSCAS